MLITETCRAGLATLTLAVCTVVAHAADAPQIRVVRKVVVEDGVAPGGSAQHGHRLRLALGIMSGTGWTAESVLEATRRAARILAQCDIRIATIELTEFEAPSRYRTLFTPISRRLAAELGLPRPTVYFVADTRQQPAFDAEAVGRANSRTRPEMADSVWIVRGARDPGIVIAHELAHVLADSGEHSKEDGNLMREETAPGGTRLTPAQCEKIVKTARANGLLRPAD